MNNTSQNVVVVMWVILVLVALIFAPLVSIWALNTLFNLNIAFNFWTWCASLWIGSFFSGVKLISKNK